MFGGIFGVDENEAGQSCDAQVAPVVVGGRHKAADGLGRTVDESRVGVDGGHGANTLVGDGCSAGGDKTNQRNLQSIKMSSLMNCCFLMKFFVVVVVVDVVL